MHLLVRSFIRKKVEKKGTKGKRTKKQTMEEMRTPAFNALQA
jgi:hypothetical protein